MTCLNGLCAPGICNPGFADCDGSTVHICEVNTDTDRYNCGACGAMCASGETCNNGKCEKLSCGEGMKLCNFGCVSTDNPSFGCGGSPDEVSYCDPCMTPNPPNGSVTCLNGLCAPGTCNPGFADCDGSTIHVCEVNTDTDPYNCGACGHVCQAPFTCTATSPGTGSCRCSSDDDCNAGSSGTCNADGRCICGSGTCAPEQQCLVDGTCG